MLTQCPTTEPRVFALLIGINNYWSTRKQKLRGAVYDAHQMRRYLGADLGVPDKRIRLLCDDDATRERIIAEFEALITNPDIQHGDALVIFFAGHGSRARVSPDWHAEGETVETICPVDEEFGDGESEIHGIPDRTIAGLVHRLASAKGGNIVSSNPDVWTLLI